MQEKIFKTVSQVADENNIEAYVIGGFVRDLFLKRPSKDIDIVAVGSGIFLAEKFTLALGKGAKLSVFKNFGTAQVKYQGFEIEFVGARKESYRTDSRKPIVENGTLEDDQNRRDFTINAMARSLNSSTYWNLLDPFDGIDDLRAKVIRTPLDPDITFSDDPLRMMRAIRFATQLNFIIDPVTLEAIKRNRGRIGIISAERIADELNKIVASPKPSNGFILLEECGLLKLIFPELSAMKGVEVKNGIGHKDNFFHTLKVLDNLSAKSDNLWLRWSAILHDIAKPVTKRFELEGGWTFRNHNFVGSKMTKSIFKRLKLPLNEKMKYVEKMVMLHMRPISLVEDSVSDSAIRRLLFEAGDDIDELMTLCEADITSKNEDRVKKHLENFALVREKLIEIEEKDRVRNFQPPVSGEEIMEVFGIKPSKEVGELKNAIKEAILEGKISNNYVEAYGFMLNLAKEMGLKPVK